MVAEIAGLIHSLTYLLARFGTLHQIVLLRKSKIKNPIGAGKNTKGISISYRGRAAVLLLIMSLWGLSLPEIDWIIILSRGLALMMFLLILRELWLDRKDRISKLWFKGCIYSLIISAIAIVFYWNWFKSLSPFLGILTIIFSFNLAFGVLDRSLKILKAKSPGQQSLIESIGQLSKDLSGIIYGLLVGFDQMWPLVISLLAIGVLRSANVFLHLYYGHFSKSSKKICHESF